ncbi:MAG: bi-domain-containing oxidoreductase [Thermodesulfobacteriota bacterium]|jgi:polar amino acid transport system substrate-binding protein|nr:MAG: bi-domain-containing oxidoreductase [Thermodesulfobacteriota bacterium]
MPYMKELTNKLRNGSLSVVDLPIPVLLPGAVLVKNYYSLISSGTEGSTVKTARKGLIGKAQERPQQVKQVIDTLKAQGVVQTYRAVMKKLEAYSPLGYSCAGEVIDLAPDVNGFHIGELVACGGLTACHAEIVCVPVNLCVKLQPEADLKQAAYNTVGSIAMQGVRQADLRLGETCAIIGLGLLGQLTALLLKASGIRSLGIDIDQSMVEIAGEHCVDLALNRGAAGIENQILDFTDGLGCDGVIITAASESSDPINFAGAIARKRGTIVVVGAVPTGFDREPYYYKKELQVKMSCSYGPGRYDPSYEEKGIDYPPGYVRWTEKRNMQAFEELIYRKKIDVSYLTTHTFKLDEAPAAYDLLLKKTEPFIGILIEYNVSKQLDRSKVVVNPPHTSRLTPHVSIGFIGAGSYAQSHLLPNIPKTKDVRLGGVMTSTSASSRSVADRFGFEFCTADEKDILENQNINTVFIATRHDSHAEYVLKALKAGKHVFVEKPLCLMPEELQEIESVYSSLVTSHASLPLLMVGYNRRFSPFAKMIKDEFGNGTMSMIYRINAGAIPPDSWIQDREAGGGRIIGEVCHFVDFLTFVTGSLPVSVYATVMNSSDNLNDTLNISLTYANGSIGTISYFANGDKSLPKEWVEIYAHGSTAIIHDFKRLLMHAQGKKKGKKLLSQNKGQETEVRLFIESIVKGSGETIPFAEIYSASLVTFKIMESIRSGQRVLM